MSTQPLVRLSKISKSFLGVHALKEVDLDILAGEVHCLVGENGAGKSTLMRVLAGATRQDAGTIEIRGRIFERMEPAGSIALGIGIIYQELDLVPAMTVAENIFLGNEPARRGMLDRRAMESRAAGILANFDVAISPRGMVRELGPAERQLVQIAKSLSHENHVLVLDEPTASLTDNEVAHLFALLRRLRESGKGIVYVSHRLEEVLSLGDRVTVLRDGERIVTRPIAGMTRQDLIEAMVGRRLTETARAAAHTGTEDALEVKNVSRRGEFEQISFTVRRGEVLGLAGLVGAGRSELLETIFGVRPADEGEVLVFGRTTPITCPRDAIDAGIGLVPEERRESGVVLDRSVADNLSLARIDQLSGLLGLDRVKVRALADEQIRSLSIKTPSPDAKVGQLSGGNQQKVAIGKWLAAGVQVLLLDEPTRGVDVNAKAEIYRLIAELAKAGAAIVVASSDLPEILAITDRILVLARGRLTGILETARTGQVEVMHYAVQGAARTSTGAAPPGAIA